MDRSLDVLVVGAGPVGLLMAAELVRHGAGCRVVERLATPSPHCKALGVTPRTLELFDDLGIAERALEAGMGLRGLVNIANGDWSSAEISGAALPEGAYGFLTLAQYDAERILAEHFDALGGRVERACELVAFEQTPESVAATLKHASGKTEKIECRYLVGCDGGRSTVRRALNVPFEGEHYEQVFLLADVELDWQLPRGFGYKLARLEDGQIRAGGACIPVPGNPRRYRFSTIAPESMIPKELLAPGQPTHGISDLGPTLNQVQEVFDWLFAPGTRLSNMCWSAFYRISHRIVSTYRAGRVFLAGDAAHLHPPLGGQGMNAGLQDAYNLAWKLALDVRSRAAAGLLDSYDAERRPIGLDIVNRTTARMNQVLEGQVEEQEPVREDSQLFLNYRHSPWVVNDNDLARGSGGPLAGDRAPDATGLRRAHMRHEARLFDVFRGPHHTLLLYTNHGDAEADCRRFCDVAAKLAEQYGNLVHTHAILHPDCGQVPLEGLSILDDVRNAFAERYFPKRGSAYLVRPDGYLGYRAAALDLAGVQAHLRRIFAC
jgi:2-polyprenyl-6-methoxyphenol hydroxylase-like FAD-dependent oxidoreductase